MAIDSTRTTTTSAATALLKLADSSGSLPSGRLLEALVVKSDGNNAMLAIAGKLIEAQTTLRLIAGMTLAVRVEEENGQQLLRIVTPETPAQPSAEQALRQALPRQAPLAEVVQRLARFDTAPPLAKQTDTNENQQQPSVAPARTSPAASTPQSVAAPLLRILPTLVQLTSAEGLKQALLNSGLFMEQHLAQGAGAQLQGDLKANLLRMVQQLATQASSKSGNGSPQGGVPDLSPESLLLFKDGEAALARIQLHQLASLPRSDTPDPQWLFELPLRTSTQGYDVLQLRIAREQRGSGDEAEPCWSVTLQLSDAQQQPLRVVVTLIGGAISATFWAAQAETAELFRIRLDELRSRLAAWGLEVGRVGSYSGPPPGEMNIEKISSGLLREKA